MKDTSHWPVRRSGQFMRHKSSFILGMAKTGGGVKNLLNLDRVLTNGEIVLLDQAS